MRSFAAIAISLGMLGGLAAANAADCPGNPNALGTSRILTIDPRQYPRLGTIQYPETLPLADKEVVLTFDDGPMPPFTNRILETLAHECVKANYFIIGRMARGYPDLLRRIHAEGHVIGTHSENHPLAFERMPPRSVQNEIDQGITSTAAALGTRNAVAPFFRIPGLLRADNVETYLRSRGLVTWSADIAADDWKHISASEVVSRTISRLESKGKGIILLHDIQPATALALPHLLRELKRRGYRVVQVAAASPPLVAGAPRQPELSAVRPQPREAFAAPRSPDAPPPLPATRPPEPRAEPPRQTLVAPEIPLPEVADLPPPDAASVNALASEPLEQAPRRTMPLPVVEAARQGGPARTSVSHDAAGTIQTTRPLTPGFKPSHSVSLPTKVSELTPAAPAIETSTSNPPGVNAPTDDTPKIDAPTGDGPNSDAPGTEAPIIEAPRIDTPRIDPWAWRASIAPAQQVPAVKAWPLTASSLNSLPNSRHSPSRSEPIAR